MHWQTSELDGAHTIMPEAECNIFQYEQLLHSRHIEPQISTPIQFKSVTPVTGLLFTNFHCMKQFVH